MEPSTPGYPLDLKTTISTHANTGESLVLGDAVDAGYTARRAALALVPEPQRLARRLFDDLYPRSTGARRGRPRARSRRHCRRRRLLCDHVRATREARVCRLNGIHCGYIRNFLLYLRLKNIVLLQLPVVCIFIIIHYNYKLDILIIIF